MRLNPGEAVKVMQGSPAPPVPYIMLTVATSLTAWKKTPSMRGWSFAMSSAPSVDGVMGYPYTCRHPARMAPTAEA